MTSYNDHWMSSMAFWQVNEMHDHHYWPLIEFNGNIHDQLLNSMTSLTIEWVQWKSLWPVWIAWPVNDWILMTMTSYKDHWMSSMTILMTSYWKAWHHILTIEWVQWQSLWPLTECMTSHYWMSSCNLYQLMKWPWPIVQWQSWWPVNLSMTSHNDHWTE